MTKLDDFIHKKLGLTYRLHVDQDFGHGQPVIFLHGIASSSSTWKNLFPLLEGRPVRVIAIDLLGFGESPSPDWVDYSLNDHARAVALTIRKLKLRQKPIIVGQSMGALIATKMASQDPDAYARLILCSMPLYLNNDYDDSIKEFAKTGRRRTSAYFKLYEILSERREFTQNSARRLSNIDKDISLELSDRNWLASTLSFKNSVIQQDILSELEKLQLPIDIIYGRLDILLISDYFSALATINDNIKLTTVSAGHGISSRYAKALVDIISKS